MKKTAKLNETHTEITGDERISGNGRHPDTQYFTALSKPSEKSHIRIQIWLPDNYNGIFLGLGGGGMAGSLIEEAPWEYLDEGYAVAYTDMGTSLYISGEMTHPDVELWRDYTWRATHIMTEVAKAVINDHYGKPPLYSYFFGESAGGLQSYSEAERFSEDYDGIIAGVSSHNALNLIVYFLWLHKTLRDESGKAIITKTLASEISLAAANFFKMHGDGEPKDTFISYPYLNENTVESFIEFLHSEIADLSKAQEDALRLAYKGPVHSITGEQLFTGLPIGSEMNSGYFTDSNDFGFSWFQLFFGDEYDDRDFDFGLYYDRILSDIGRDFTAVSDNFEPFRAHGGKFISYVGTADPAGPWAEALKHYNSVCDKMGGYDKVSEFFKLFILPGRGHNKRHGLGLRLPLGDNGQPLLSVIRAWREDGKTPDYIIGVHRETNEAGEIIKEFSRKIMPYRADKVKEGIDYPKCTSDRIMKFLNRRS